MHQRSVWLGCVVCLVLAGSATALAHGSRRSVSAAVCGPVGARTLAADRVARVYSLGKNVFGCARFPGESYMLGTSANSFDQGRAGPVALAGVDAAYGLTTYGVDTVAARVLVRRLTDGKALRQRSAISGSVGAEFFETVDAVVVKRDGSLAWIAHARSIPSGDHGITEVEKSDRTSQTLLDRSPRIRRGSLRLRGSELSWRDGATKKTATLR